MYSTEGMYPFLYHVLFVMLRLFHGTNEGRNGWRVRAFDLSTSASTSRWSVLRLDRVVNYRIVIYNSSLVIYVHRNFPRPTLLHIFESSLAHISTANGIDGPLTALWPTSRILMETKRK